MLDGTAIGLLLFAESMLTRAFWFGRIREQRYDRDRATLQHAMAYLKQQ